MLDKLSKIAECFEENTALLNSPEIISDSKYFQKLSKEQARIFPLVEVFKEITAAQKELENNQQLASDPNEDSEIRELAKEEVRELKNKIKSINDKAKILLLPQDPDDGKNTILEIRAGTGGEEAALFAANLYKMYLKFAELNKWKVETLNKSQTGIGGIKEIALSIKGKNVYSRLKFEAGIHRVQRVPLTETQGRLHTSAVTVAVLPEAEDIEIEVKASDLRIDTYRSQGAGGQHVNTSDSAVRITHLPSGIVATCQEERSQLKNRNKAMKHIKAKLYEAQTAAAASNEAELRKHMVGSGDRSGRIRTYNYAQGRITDHRIGLSIYRLDDIMNSSGNINEIVDSLLTHHQADLLKKQESL